MAPRASRFIVLGAGGHGRVVADLVRCIGHEVVGYADADVRKLGAAADGTDARVVLSQAELLACLRGDRAWRFSVEAVALGIGDNATRADLLEAIGAAMLPPLVHPRAWAAATARLGAGCVVLAGAVINTDATLADGVIVNSRATVEHDCVVGRAAHISPGATLCGGVRVGDGSWVGAGAVVIPGVVVGAGSMVGAGAVVIRDVPGGATVAGNPARPISGRLDDRSASRIPGRAGHDGTHSLPS